MADTYLFVGGPADGDWRETNGDPVFVIAERSRFGTPDSMTRVYTYRYRAEPFQEGDVRHLVYFHDSVQPGTCLAELIRGYRRG